MKSSYDSAPITVNNPGPITTPPQQPATGQDPGASLIFTGIVLAFMGLSPIGLIYSILGSRRSREAGFKNNLASFSLGINILFLFILGASLASLIALGLIPEMINLLNPFS